MKRIHKWSSYLCMILVITAMIAAAQLTGKNEVIFPEMAAIGLGIFVSPNRSWATNKKMMFLLISIAAVIGVLIVRFAPGDKWVQMIIAFAVSQIILIYSRTTFAPFVSALVLPVMLGDASIAYLLSAIILTALIMGITAILEHVGIWNKGPYEKPAAPQLSDWGNAGIRILIAGVMIYVALKSGLVYMAAPPLLVAFTEFLRPFGAAPKKPGKVIVLVTLCAVIGCGCRGIFDLWLGLRFGMTLAGAVACVLVIALVLKMKLFLPPAAALAILPMLIPSDKVLWYSLHVLIGITVYTLVAVFMKKKGWIIPYRKNTKTEFGAEIAGKK